MAGVGYTRRSQYRPGHVLALAGNLSSETRMRTRVVWDSIIFLLDGIVFILIGLQLPDILKDMKGYSPGEAIGYGLIVSAVAIVVRIIWVFTSAYGLNLLRQKDRSAVAANASRGEKCPGKVY